MSRPNVLLLVGVVFAAGGCGEGEATPTVKIRGLPVQQEGLIADLCQGPGELDDRRNREIRARARRGLQVLMRTLRTRPEARVTTSHYEEGGLFSAGGRKTEVLSVRELAKDQAFADDSLDVVLSATGGRPSCVVPLRSELLRASDAMP